MKKERLDNLSDSLFAIVMTLLVFEIKVPDVYGIISNERLFQAIESLTPLLSSYLLSFALLFTYWRAHNYIMSVYAKNIDVTLSNLNAIFLLFVALVPFSSHFLSAYYATQVGITLFGTNMIAIGLSLFAMRRYVIKSKTIVNAELSSKEFRHGTIRTMVPVFCALGAIILSFFSTAVSLQLYTLAVIFNLLPKTADVIDSIFFRKEVLRESTSS